MSRTAPRPRRPRTDASTRRVWTASHNPTLVDLMHRLNLHLVRYPTTTLTHGDRWEAVLREQEELLGAIEARDGEAARRIA
jgi:DNA-binding FadR family transcriptional regulator